MTTLDVASDEAIDLRLAKPRFSSTLEKWYVDALLDDGTVVIVYLGRLRLLGITWARVTAEVFFPDGRVLRGGSPAAELRGERGRLRFGDTCIEGEYLGISAGEVRGELRFRERGRPVHPQEPLIAVGSRKLTWVVEVPDADVEGHLTWPSGRLEVRGRGYRDRVFFDLLPWRFPIQRLVWGRAVAGESAALWLHAEPRPPRRRSLGDAPAPIRNAWLDGEAIETRPDSVPAPVELGAARTLLDAHVADLEGLRFGPARGLLRRLTGDPHERKLAATCTIRGAPGRAIHEVVTWKRPWR